MGLGDRVYLHSRKKLIVGQIVGWRDVRGETVFVVEDATGRKYKRFEDDLEYVDAGGAAD